MAAVKGGEKIAAKIEQIRKKLTNAKQVRAGFLEGATYPDGTSVAMVAAANEFGSTGEGRFQPPRPFFRQAIDGNKTKWSNGLAKSLMKDDAQTALSKAGEVITGDVQSSIQSLVSPALAQSTIKAKGFDKPLIDTGHMLRSIDYEVE